MIIGRIPRVEHPERGDYDEKIEAHTFHVTVKELGTSAEHRVRLDDEYYYKLTDGNITKMELIRLSFRFLLRREAKELIPAEFNLSAISRYFFDYEGEISVK